MLHSYFMLEFELTCVTAALTFQSVMELLTLFVYLLGTKTADLRFRK